MARNDGVDRTSVRNLAVSDKAVGNTQQHNEREKDSYRNPDIIPQRTAWNVHFKKPTASYTDLFAQLEAAQTISTRGLKPDATHYCELVFDVNSAYFDNHGGYEFAKQFYADAYKAAVQIVGGEQYILSAVMHADEINRSMTEALGRELPLPSSCGLCACGGKANPLVETLQGQGTGGHSQGDRHAGQPEQEVGIQAPAGRCWRARPAKERQTSPEEVVQCPARRFLPLYAQHRVHRRRTR